MEITRSTIGIVAGVSLVAGAAGALVATHVGTPAQAAPPASRPRPARPQPAVEESEGVVDAAAPRRRRDRGTRGAARRAPGAHRAHGRAGAPSRRRRTAAPRTAAAAAAPRRGPTRPAPAPVEAPRVAEVAPAVARAAIRGSRAAGAVGDRPAARNARCRARPRASKTK